MVADPLRYHHIHIHIYTHTNSAFLHRSPHVMAALRGQSPAGRPDGEDDAALLLRLFPSASAAEAAGWRERAALGLFLGASSG